MNSGTITGYAPVDHPGTPVPQHLREWAVDWPDYNPVDITPPELREPALSAPAAWITDPLSTPTDITDWDQRQRDANLPFFLDEDFWPLNPTGRTGRTGRNLGRWGENAAADPIVIAGTGTLRRILLIRRQDLGVWALPGGMVDPGETAPAALVRELHEETGADLGHLNPHILGRTYVHDWRATDHAWVTTTVALYELTEVAPTVAGDDATDARWWPWNGNVQELAALLEVHGGLYSPHRPLLAAR